MYGGESEYYKHETEFNLLVVLERTMITLHEQSPIKSNLEINQWNYYKF